MGAQQGCLSRSPWGDSADAARTPEEALRMWKLAEEHGFTLAVRPGSADSDSEDGAGYYGGCPRSSTQSDDEPECMICLGTDTDEEWLRTTCCFQLLCGDCHAEHLSRSEQPRCPVCRQVDYEVFCPTSSAKEEPGLQVSAVLADKDGELMCTELTERSRRQKEMEEMEMIATSAIHVYG